MDTRSSYDRVAAEYAERIAGELAGKPLDRALLDRFAARVGPLGPACDLGCGPAHVGEYLRARGLRVHALDLSHGMLREARALFADLACLQADMRALPVAAGAWGGAAAFYSLIHIPRPELPAMLAGLHQALRPGGLLLAAFHIGQETVHLDEWWGQAVALDFLFFEPDELAGYLRAAGFAVDEIVTREPYPSVEHPSRRGYLWGSKAPV
jgi:SAM-dependent methyltransferase